MRCFETRGPVSPEDNYVVTRADELADFIARVEKGRYIVLFAPRQTGKTSFFQSTLEVLEEGVHFNRDNEIIAELATYGVLTKDARRMCKIVSPIYQHRIMQAFKPSSERNTAC